MRQQVGLVNTKKGNTNLSGISSNMLPAQISPQTHLNDQPEQSTRVKHLSITCLTTNAPAFASILLVFHLSREEIRGSGTTTWQRNHESRGADLGS
jgi:hypothetical protein